MKNRRKIMKNPFFALVTLAAAVVCLLAVICMPDTDYHADKGKLYFTGPESYCMSEDGCVAVVDDKKTIYCFDRQGKMVYRLRLQDLGCENGEMDQIVFGEDGQLYCHLMAYNDLAYLTDYESVIEINATGKMERELVRIDYRNDENAPSRQPGILDIACQSDRLFYVYQDSENIELNSVNLLDSKTETATVKLEGYAGFISCQKVDGRYLTLKNNGEAGYLSADGTYSPFYKAEYSIQSGQGMRICDVYAAGDEVYMLAYEGNAGLYRKAQDGWQKLLPVAEAAGIDEDSLGEFGLGECGGVPTLYVNDKLYQLSGETLVEFGDFSLPSGVRILCVLKNILMVMGVILLICSLVSGIGNRMRWHISFLARILLSIVPLVIVMLSVVAGYMFVNMSRLYSQDIIHETVAVNEIAADLFNGDEISRITGYENVDSGEISALNNRLKNFVNGNKSDWSKNYTCAVYLKSPDHRYIMAGSSDGSRNYMLSSFTFDQNFEDNFYQDSHTCTFDMEYGENGEDLYLILVTPMYRDDNSYDAVMVLVASQQSLTRDILGVGKKLLLYIVLWVAVLALVIHLVVAYNVRYLRKAKDAVGKIADGDFSVRILSYKNDEVGEICAGVNDMAEHLETYFQEKNRNERFYYKFVPEKFREFLDKEQFTDLALGDAVSKDLTIMFCDIRAFSLNSEMMTVKESFEFVNHIYGAAGPVIREHNGFVDKYIGDAVMALFESADDAVAAGIELYKKIVSDTALPELFGMERVNIGIGIHSGMSQIGIVGEEERMSGTVISDVVNLSSRLESLTKQYETAMLISKDTLDRMENPDILHTRYLGMVQVAGVNEVVALYEVLDCLEKSVRENREKSSREFREAVRLFHMGKLEPALDKFNEISENSGNDKVPAMYAAYLRGKIETGDFSHNVFQFKNK
jgi:class 3 adenylate cyclase